MDENVLSYLKHFALHLYVRNLLILILNASIVLKRKENVRRSLKMLFVSRNGSIKFKSFRQKPNTKRKAFLRTHSFGKNRNFYSWRISKFIKYFYLNFFYYNETERMLINTHKFTLNSRIRIDSRPLSQSYLYENIILGASSSLEVSEKEVYQRDKCIGI